MANSKTQHLEQLLNFPDAQWSSDFLWYGLESCEYHRKQGWGKTHSFHKHLSGMYDVYMGGNKRATEFSSSVDTSMEDRYNFGPTPIDWSLWPETMTWEDSDLRRKWFSGWRWMPVTGTISRNGSTQHIWLSLPSAALLKLECAC